MTDEQKAQLKELAKSEEITPSYRHVASTPREASPSSEGARSRGPSRSNPLYLGRIALAAHKAKAFLNFQDIQNTIIPCDEREAVALFSSPPWMHHIGRGYGSISFVPSTMLVRRRQRCDRSDYVDGTRKSKV